MDNESGATLEDMAQRAWNEGYFPELSRPPTPQEFVAALDDTYRGVGRRFRPDDEAEIQAFEGARDQRLAVERSRQDGAPLADDMGQPATYDDMIANTPPATAYDDWNNAVVSKVGNIRVDKLDTPQEIGQALKIADNSASDFFDGHTDARARGKLKKAVFDLHQSAERMYHCVLLVCTFYTPHVHNLAFLRTQAERLDMRLVDAWPRERREDRARFEKLKEAYVKARYSKHYRITEEELQWLSGCVEELGRAVHAICSERIAELEARAGQNPPLAPV
ncbi:HEPN domain-containing protein [Sphingopyxis granuli]|uniref:HEPN domain-containing protein n=1 Tax=Sphingopyxis granuli TaxID=267128 RepID=UPI001F53BDA0|nr:HEPN domain-containing protein [Sphingopyxis granuli]UNK78432.1 HEPN domain-containing protein [Sphingopyxis granuli]